jgi:hypothetical protein
LEQLAITPLTPEPEEPAKLSTAPMGTFEKGVATGPQDKARKGSVKVPRAHVERLENGSEVKVKLGTFLSNSKSRRA